MRAPSDKYFAKKMETIPAQKMAKHANILQELPH